jgi:competence ComEA-like helix-hairpin-helix protein
MKRNTVLSVGLLVLMLTLGSIAYGQGGMDGSSGGSSQSPGSTGTGSEQGMGGTSGSAGAEGGMGTSGQAQVQLVDINTASAQELQKVPGMTSSMAKNIVKYRDQNGPFSSVDDLTKVKGVDEKKLNKMRSHLTVGPSGTQQPMGGGQGGTGGMGTGGEGAGGMGGGTGGEGAGGTGGGTGGTGSGGTGGSGSGSGGTGY